MFKYTYHTNNGCSKGGGTIPPRPVDPVCVEVRAENEEYALRLAKRARIANNYILIDVVQI